MSETRKLEYEKKPFVTDRLVEACYQKILEGDDRIAHVATLERRGGNCPICSRPFSVVHVDNAFGKFDYYEPSCRCYHKCETVYFKNGNSVRGCGRTMISERAMGVNYCISCYNPDNDKSDMANRSSVAASRGRARD